MVFMDEWGDQDPLTKYRMTRREKLKDEIRQVQQMVARRSKTLEHTQYVVDHPESYDDFVVETYRKNISGDRADLEYWQDALREAQEEYFALSECDRTH